MDSLISYCLCGRSFDIEQFMIQCDVCKQWYHGGCVAVKEYMSTDIDKYHCPRCENTCGPSLMKIRMNWHRHDYSDPNADSKPVQTGTPVFIRELKSRHFLKADDVVKHVRGQQLTLQYLQNNGFMTPIIVDSKDGLDMIMPPPNFSVYDVESYIGGDREMDVIDVTKQNNIRMKLRDFVEYYNSPSRSRVFNVISLEFSNTGIYELEKKMKTPMKFQYPGFETINWFAAKKLLKELKDLNNEGKKCPSYFLQGTKALLSILKQWNTDKDYNMISRSQIPETINSQKLLKEFSKEIRHAERYLISLNPPKPERESKRKKKKPLNKDFVNYDYADEMINSPFRTILKETKSIESTIRDNLPSTRPPLKLTLPKPIVYPYVDTTTTTTTTTTTPIADEKPKVSPNKKTVKSRRQSSTVIRFKLGNNEVVRSTNANMKIKNNGNSVDHTISNSTDKKPGWKKTSVYDFHDGSNESDYGKFTIDESPKRKKNPKSNTQKKLKSANSNDTSAITEIPKNGIEELIKASVYTLESTSSKLDVATPTMISQYRQSLPPPPTGASPSTREAIAGMLSFSEQCYSTTSDAPKKSVEPVTKSQIKEDDDQSIENIEKVHQDDDFIYPALDASDDDDYIFKPKTKDQIDEAWNPKARVGPLLPKTNRPAREGVRKTSVEKGLEAAAAKREKQLNSTKRAYNKKKQKAPPSTDLTKQKLNITDESLKINSAYSSILTSPNRLNDVKAKLAAPVPAERKPKKGMKTAKQRLGKILKLHKMMH